MGIQIDVWKIRCQRIQPAVQNCENFNRYQIIQKTSHKTFFEEALFIVPYLWSSSQ